MFRTVKKYDYKAKRVFFEDGNDIECNIKFFPVDQHDKILIDVERINSWSDVKQLRVEYCKDRLISFLFKSAMFTKHDRADKDYLLSLSKSCMSGSMKGGEDREIFDKLAEFSEKSQIREIKRLIVELCGSSVSSNPMFHQYCVTLMNIVYSKWIKRRLYVLGFDDRDIQNCLYGPRDTYNMLFERKISPFALIFCNSEHSAEENKKNLKLCSTVCERLNEEVTVSSYIFYDILASIQKHCLANRLTYMKYEDYRKLVIKYKEKLEEAVGEELEECEIDRELMFRYELVIEEEARVYTFYLKNVEDVCYNFLNQCWEPMSIFKGDIGDDPELTEEQMSAIRTALACRVSIMTGGPGCGKTKTISKLVNLLSANIPGSRIQLASPTGKSIYRIKESCSDIAFGGYGILEPATIDSLICKKEFEHFNFLIIDEVSMLSEYLFSRFVRKYNHRYHIFFVGDDKQLPAIGVGCLLNSLLRANVYPVTTLTKNFRCRGTNNAVYENILSLEKDCKFTMREGFSVKHTGGNFNKDLDEILKCVGSLTKKYGTDGVKVLSFFNDIVPSANEFFISNFVDKVKHSNMLLPGVEVYVNENIYTEEINLYNGTIGKIKAVDEKEGTVTVSIRLSKNIERDVIFGKGTKISIGNLTPNYCFTVHKSQGSEYDAIILYCRSVDKAAPDDFFNLNILYTAISRAKSEVVVMGDLRVIEKCMNNGFIEYDDHLAERLMNRKME